ncbi:siroheme synthase CysG [Amaricoccus macauensis]|uniref:siroheme synthase CysG n=1 Tax=Amaricoccus macauensis TaxID=57001 RepID=UPI003C7E32AC
MKTFPMFLKLEGRRVVIAGGGEQAAQKTRLMLKTEAEIVIAADTVEPELAALAARGRIRQQKGPVTCGTFRGAALVFICTGDALMDTALAGCAKTAGVVANVVDRPDLCDAFTPSLVDRDPVVVAIGTEGTAPVLGRQIKTRIEEMLEPRLGDLAALAGRLRDLVAERIPMKSRRAFWGWVFNGEPRLKHSRGAEREAARMIKEAIEAGGQPLERNEAGFVSLVGAGPGIRDLITLRGVQRLQEADIIFYDRLVDPDLLELARRDAERVYVGKEPGVPSWPQDRINGVIVAAAREGKRVVRLKSGDPGIFGRGAEEAESLQAAGIEWEIVPGVTAASAATASLDGFLTERGVTDAVVLTTGHTREGFAIQNWANHLHPGTTLALYMAIASSGRIQADMLAQGLPASLPVEIVSRAASPDQQIVRTRLERMAQDIEAAEVRNPAILLIRYPKDMAVEKPENAANAG